jgi:hypothetical protein
MTADTPPTVANPPRPKLLRRVAPAVALFFLAPLCGEFLIGNVPIDVLVFGLLVLAPMYGGGALLIREVARRARLGWPAILLLGLAYGLIEAGMFDQTMFNPSPEFLESAEIAEHWENSRSVTFIPAFGISVQQALGFVVGHAVTSIGVPILIVETFVPRRRVTPWLGKPGLAVTGVLYLLGGFIIYQDQTATFHASGGQILGTAAVAAALVGLAFAVGRRRGGRQQDRPRTSRPAPSPWTVGAVALAAVIIVWSLSEPLGWAGVALQVLVLAAMTTLVVRWSRREGWSATHRLALGGAVLLTDALSGFVLTSLYGRTEPIHLIGNIAFTLAVALLIVVAARAVRRTPDVT